MTEEPAAAARRPPSPRTRALRLVGWAVTVAVVAVAVVVVRDRWSAVGAAGGLPDAGPTAAAGALFLAANAVLALSWWGVVRLVGRRIAPRDAVWVWSLSQLYRYAIGSAQVAGRAALATRHGLSATVGATTALLELAWLLGLTAAIALGTLPWWLPTAGELDLLAWTAALPVAGLGAALVRPQALVRAAVAVTDWGPIDRLTGGRFRGALAGLTVRRRDVLRLTAAYAANNGLRVAAFLLLVEAVGADVAEVGLAAAGAYSVGQLVGWLAVIAPGGLGPREGATVLVLTPAVGAVTAVVLAASARLLEVAAELAFLGLAAVGRRLAST